jgi:hypothetical protein
VLAGNGPGFLLFMPVESSDAVDGQVQGVRELRVDLLEGRVDLVLADLELVKGEIRSVEFAGVLQQGGIT